MGKKRAKLVCRRTVLRPPDLDHSKTAVLNSLSSPGSRRTYQFAIEEFIAWYCSEPRLAFNHVVVVRYRMHLEAPSERRTNPSQFVRFEEFADWERASPGGLLAYTGKHDRLWRCVDTAHSETTTAKINDTLPAQETFNCR